MHVLNIVTVNKDNTGLSTGFSTLPNLSVLMAGTYHILSVTASLFLTLFSAGKELELCYLEYHRLMFAVLETLSIIYLKTFI